MDPVVLKDGGKRRKPKSTPTPKRTTKPASAKKPAAAKPKKGGSLPSDVEKLAVPFAILLAKQGLESMFADKKKTSPSAVGVAKSPKTKAKTASASKQSGGTGCSACAASVPTQAGGKARGGRARSSSSSVSMKNSYESLAQRLERFLATH